MAIYWAIYESDDVTPAAPIDLTGANAIAGGASSAVLEYHVWNDLGGIHGGGADTIRTPGLRITASNGVDYVATGEPLVDDWWALATVTGVIKTGDPTMPDYVSASKPIGAFADLDLPDIPPNCAVKVTLVFRAPGLAADVTQNFHIGLVYNEPSEPLTKRIAVPVGGGVIPGHRLPELWQIARGLTLSADGTAVVTVARGADDYYGLRRNHVAQTGTLNQNAADGALGVGESYIARVSLNAAGTAVYTKGNKGGAPTAPALPASSLHLGLVTVDYDAGGTSVIDTADLDMTGTRRGDYQVAAGAGLSVDITPGYAMADSDRTMRSGATINVPVDASIQRSPEAPWNGSSSSKP